VPEHRAAWDAAVEQVRRGDGRQFDLALRHHDGREAILAQALYPIRGAAGQTIAIEGTARDITTVRQLETLKARNEERASLERLKSQLLANVSHELRTPLVSIKGYNDLLLRGALGPLTPRQRRGLEIAGANTERLIELIESLLDFARREEERLELHVERFDLRVAVDDAISALRERIASRNLELRLDLGAVPIQVKGDRPRLAQVFRALIGNAEKFTEGHETHGRGEIRIEARNTKETAEVSITDSGIGIPKELHEKIFDRFYQVDASSTRRFGGAGLGLALARELVGLHGGSIRVDSAEGRGSTFTVSLPLATRESGAFEVVPPRPVVLVGADEETWRALRPMLESGELGPLDVFPAHSEADVVRRAKRHRPDLVLVAFAQPDEVVSQLKHGETSSLPVVVVTAEGTRPVGRADLVTNAQDAQRLVAGLMRLLGRVDRPARNPQVVVVEDEVEILDFTRFVLEREGYEVLCMQTAAEAMRAVTPQTSLVVLDIALEGDDGIDVCKALKAAPRTRDVPILIMTAMSGEEVRRVSLAAGAAGYLVKPFGVDEFVRQVRLHMRAPHLNPLDSTEKRT
jgi:signal transduction histidine kinase/DNA-binding response OmpR family regulator